MLDYTLYKSGTILRRLPSAPVCFVLLGQSNHHDSKSNLGRKRLTVPYRSPIKGARCMNSRQEPKAATTEKHYNALSLSPWPLPPACISTFLIEPRPSCLIYLPYRTEEALLPRMALPMVGWGLASVSNQENVPQKRLQVSLLEAISQLTFSFPK